ncbi:MAG: TraR/DksA C4-type zinc finger protein [Pseudomonadota bacterium]
MTALAERKQALTHRLAELNTRLHHIETELESHTTADWEDLAQEREGDEVLEHLGLNGQDEIRMIEAALARMDAGEYGFCVQCGNEILPERLDVLPFTPLCRVCANKAAAH